LLRLVLPHRDVIDCCHVCLSAPESQLWKKNKNELDEHNIGQYHEER